jgi:alpha-tubulin suppressor-like RCC1 family protein
VWAWGYNGNGQLGDGTTTERTTPVQVLQLQSQLQNVVSIAAGQDFSVALKSDGTVWGWGYNGNGHLATE